MAKASAWTVLPYQMEAAALTYADDLRQQICLFAYFAQTEQIEMEPNDFDHRNVFN